MTDEAPTYSEVMSAIYEALDAADVLWMATGNGPSPEDVDRVLVGPEDALVELQIAFDAPFVTFAVVDEAQELWTLTTNAPLDVLAHVATACALHVQARDGVQAA